MLAVLLLSKAGAFCQDSLQHNQQVFGAKLHYGSVLVHSQAVKNVSGSKPFGIELEYSTHKINAGTYNICNCYPRNGFVVTYYNFNNHILGEGFAAAYFLEPNYRMSKHVQFVLKGTAGITYVTRPYDAITNPDNHNYTVHVNPYLQVGGGFNFQLNTHTTFALMESLQHFSNGGFKEPNRGVNWYTTSVGVLYYPGDNNLPQYHRTRDKFWKHLKPYVDAGILYVPQQGYNSKTKAQPKFLLGGFGQITKQVGGTSALTIGAEIYYYKMIENSPTPQNSSASPVLAGVHAGHAFLLGRVKFTQQVGVYVFNQTTYYKRMYLRFGLDYRIAKHLLVGVNLKTHADNADFADARLIYRF